MKTTRIRIAFPDTIRCISIPTTKNIVLTSNFNSGNPIGIVNLEFDDEGELYAEVLSSLVEEYPKDSVTIAAGGDVQILSSKIIVFNLTEVSLVPNSRNSVEAVQYSKPAEINADADYRFSPSNLEIVKQNLEIVYDRVLKKLGRHGKR